LKFVDFETKLEQYIEELVREEETIAAPLSHSAVTGGCGGR